MPDSTFKFGAAGAANLKRDAHTHFLNTELYAKLCHLIPAGFNDSIFNENCSVDGITGVACSKRGWSEMNSGDCIF